MDKGKTTDWTDALRRQLDDYEVSAPDGLWADIEQRLDDGLHGLEGERLSVQVGQPRRRMPLLKWGMAASFAALVAGGSYVFLRPSRPLQVQAIQQASGEAPVPAVQAALCPPKATPPHAAIASPVVQCAVPVRHATDNMAGGEQVTVADTLAGGESTSDAPAEKVMRRVESLTSAETPAAGAAPATDGVLLASDNTDILVAGKQGNLAGWSVRLYGENGLISGGSGRGGQSSDMLVASAAPATGNGESSNLSPTLLTAVQEVPVRTTHHMPVSVGIQAGIPLCRNLSLSTGLVYTQARSEFAYHHYGTESTTTQTLHYVGIPVGIDYGLWSTRWLRTYVSVGAEGAVCVSNRTMEEDGSRVGDAPRDRMQWSAQWSAGVQFDILPQLGIYAEPGVKYYFDNGSNVENVFKKRKFNFNFQLGLRWNIK